MIYEAIPEEGENNSKRIFDSELKALEFLEEHKKAVPQEAS